MGEGASPPPSRAKKSSLPRSPISPLDDVDVGAAAVDTVGFC